LTRRQKNIEAEGRARVPSLVVRGLDFEFAPLLHELRRLHEGVACGGTEHLLYNLVVDVGRANVCTVIAI
jgi:hypothetical protein